MSEAPIVIVGGGPAGCAAAIALRRQGLGPVLIVDKGAYEADRIGESIPPDCRLLLDQLGLLEAFEREEHEVCQGSVSSWGDDAVGHNDFAFNPHGAGFHLDRRRFDAFMARQALEAGAKLSTRTRLRGARPRSEGAGFELRLQTEQGDFAVVASQVIDATGSGARFARSRGAKRRMHDLFYCATGYFHLREGAGLTQLTQLEAVPEGWWYAARLPDRRVAVAFACDGALIKERGLHHSSAWLEQLSHTRHIAPSLRECFYLPDTLGVCPIPCFVLDRPAEDSWLAVGDAASSFDPLSAQGIYKALATGILAAEAIEAMRGGDEDALGRYTERVHRAFEAYTGQRDQFYEREQRWPRSSFWRHRRSASTNSR